MSVGEGRIDVPNVNQYVVTRRPAKAKATTKKAAKAAPAKVAPKMAPKAEDTPVVSEPETSTSAAMLTAEVKPKD